MQKDDYSNLLFEDFGDNALIFDAIFWVCANSEADIRQMRSDIRFRIYELFNEHDITIAYPQRDIHIDGMIQVQSVPKVK